MLIRLVVLTLLLLGAVPVFSTPADAIIARVNGEPILLSQLKQSALEQRVPTRALMGDLLHNQEYRRAITLLVDEALLVQQATQEQLKVDDAAVAREVEAMLTELRTQFGGEAEVNEFLGRQGLTLETLRSILTTRERRRVLAARVVLKRVPLEAAGVEEFSKARIARGEPVEEISLSQIILALPDGKDRATEKLALTIAREAGADPRNFPRLAREHSIDEGSRERGGYLGWLNPETLRPELRGQLTGMQPGQVSPPIRTSEGVHIVLLHSRRDARDLLFAENFARERDRIIKDLRARANIKLYDLEGNPLDFRPADLNRPTTSTQ